MTSQRISLNPVQAEVVFEAMEFYVRSLDSMLVGFRPDEEAYQEIEKRRSEVRCVLSRLQLDAL